MVLNFNNQGWMVGYSFMETLTLLWSLSYLTLTIQGRRNRNGHDGHGRLGSPGSGTLLGNGNYKLREPNRSIYRQIREPFSVGWVGMEAGFEIAAWGWCWLRLVLFV